MKVSVVVAVYNSEQFLRPCMEGLKAQTFKDFETILVVDSRSRDDSVTVAEMLAPLYDGTKVVIQNDDCRAGGARNIGIDASRGDYIWFLDVDDCFSDCFIEEMVKIAEENAADVAVCNFYYSRKGKHVGGYDKPNKVYCHDNEQAMIELNTGRYSTNLFNKLIRSSMIKDNGIRMSPRYCEDYQFLAECFKTPCKVAYCTRPMYTYILSEGTRSSGEGNRIAEEDIRIFGETIQWAETSGFHDIKRLYNSGLTHVLRSLTNVDRGCYNDLIKSKTIMDASTKCGWSSKEIILFKISKSLFYRLGAKARKRKFSSDGFLFDSEARISGTAGCR